jgi:phage FluMu gp28-like protein
VNGIQANVALAQKLARSKFPVAPPPPLAPWCEGARDWRSISRFGSLSRYAHGGLDALRASLPAREWNAILAWLTTFFPYQIEWLLDLSDFSLILKSRQIGASHTLAAKAVLLALLGETTTVISVGQREADEVVNKAERHAYVLAGLGSHWARPGSKEGYRKASELRFESSGRVIALPSTSGGRGFTGNVLLDEFAYHGKSAEEVWDAAAAVTMHGGRLCVVSTPNGIGNLFYDLWSDPRKHAGYMLHETTIHDALDDGLAPGKDERKRLLDKCWKMARGDARLFAQLFEGSFLDDQQQYIPSELVDQATWSGPVPIVDGFAVAGLDIGLENDLTALVVVKIDAKGNAYVVDVRTTKRSDWDEQMSMILLAAQAWDVKLLSVDATGLGEVPARMLQKQLGRHRVDLVHFTQQSKAELATGMFERFATRSVILPDDPKLKSDVCSIRRIVSDNGGIRYDAHRTEEGHADRAWALALALRACSPLRAGGTRKSLGGGDFRRTY